MITYDQGEKIIHIARRHGLAFILETVFLVLSGLFPYFAYQVGALNWLQVLYQTTNNVFFVHLALYGLWILFLWLLFFIAWSDYYLDVWIITDGRVIDVEQKGIFRRKITTVRLDKIIGMTISQSWLGRMLNYGNLEIQLTDEEGKMVIAETPRPDRIREMIADGQKAALTRLQKLTAPKVISTESEPG